MPREDLLEMEGTLKEACGGGKYQVTLDTGNNVVLAQLCGKMKQNKIRVLPGDRVKVGVSPYDTSHGIILRRY